MPGVRLPSVKSMNSITKLLSKTKLNHEALIPLIEKHFSEILNEVQSASIDDLDDLEIEKEMWTKIIYRAIKESREQIRRKKSVEESFNRGYLKFLDVCIGFYTLLYEIMCRKSGKLDLLVFSIPQSKFGISGINGHSLKTLSRLLINLGDLTRYKEQVLKIKHKGSYWYYNAAFKVFPSSGYSLNQLSLVAALTKGGEVTSLFFALRSLIADIPFRAGKINVSSLLEKSVGTTHGFIKNLILVHTDIFAGERVVNDSMDQTCSSFSIEFQKFSEKKMIEIFSINLMHSLLIQVSEADHDSLKQLVLLNTRLSISLFDLSSNDQYSGAKAISLCTMLQFKDLVQRFGVWNELENISYKMKSIPMKRNFYGFDVYYQGAEVLEQAVELVSGNIASALFPEETVDDEIIMFKGRSSRKCNSRNRKAPKIKKLPEPKSGITDIWNTDISSPWPKFGGDDAD